LENHFRPFSDGLTLEVAQSFIKQSWTDGEEFTFPVMDIKEAKVGDDVKLEVRIQGKLHHVYGTFISYDEERGGQLTVLVKRTV